VHGRVLPDPEPQQGGAAAEEPRVAAAADMSRLQATTGAVPDKAVDCGASRAPWSEWGWNQEQWLLVAVACSWLWIRGCVGRSTQDAECGWI
jgi:hypothetical protein